MLRKTTCTAAGLALACAAASTLLIFGQPSEATNLDLRWLYPVAKEDRLPVTRVPPADHTTVVSALPSQNMTIVAKRPTASVMESAVRTPRNTIRTLRIQPVREVPNEKPEREKLPEGCEPAFSPVTVPALAHVGARCDS
jgi:hypothetical protein